MSRKEGDDTLAICKGLVYFFIFYAFFSYASYFSRPHTPAYFFIDSLKDLFLYEEFPEESTHIYKSFGDVQTYEEMYQYIEGPLLGGLYVSEDYAGNPLPDTKKNKYLYGIDLVTSAVRMTQVRIKNGSCEVPDLFKESIFDCSVDYTSKSEDTEDFRFFYNESTFTPNETIPYSHQNPWTWHSSSELKGLSYQGRQFSYPGSGYIVDLPPDADMALEVVRYLQENQWVDDHTRVLFIDFTVYNANLNLFAVIRLAFEHTAGGAVFPTSTFRCLRLIRNLTRDDTIVFFVEIATVCFAFILFLNMIRKVWKYGFRGFIKRNLWNMLDIMIITVYITIVALRLMVNSAISDQLDHFDPTDLWKYTNFQDTGFIMNQELNVLSVLNFLMTFRWFRYVTVSRRLAQLMLVLQVAAGDLISLIIVMAIVFWGYVSMGQIAFGIDVSEFRNIAQSALTLFRAALGDVDFQPLYDANRFLGPVFYISFMFLMLLVLLNMLIGILGDTYTVVREQIANDPDVLLDSIVKYFKQSFIGRKLLGEPDMEWVSNKLLSFDMIDKDNDNKISLAELRGIRNDHREAFCKAFGRNATAVEVLGLFDKDGDGFLQEKEFEKLKAQLIQAKKDVQEEKTMKEWRKVQLENYKKGRDVSSVMQQNQQSMVVLMRQISELREQVGSLQVQIAESQRHQRYNR
ncbi:hypothetical protein PCE1_004619 [Barthelona sp. PCE]